MTVVFTAGSTAVNTASTEQLVCFREYKQLQQGKQWWKVTKVIIVCLRAY